MAKYVCNTAMISCSMSLPVPLVPPLEPPKEPPGPNPCQVPLVVLPISRVLLSNQPMATKMDFVPFLNIPTFGLCVSPDNEAVKLAGGFPVPCTPVVTSPWTAPKVNVQAGNLEALLDTCTCQCTLGSGTISVASAGQSDTQEG